ncbi:MAG: RdgB/HAM1 family non-canonical purine NTP pyrophosphatase [Endomicrobium sp.]|jgi:XTP/dITP diphosphohydrolase|nr:RdgB/HAM1 family non-canonical purine NTP pyrophosphatase [Endomicrobium sp.]
MINRIILATNNRHKVEEIKLILKDVGIEIVPMTSFSSYPVTIENEKTLEKNASKKAREAADFFKEWTIADDSGIEVDYLDGNPGVYSARYAGEKCSSYENNKKLLEALKNVPQKKRIAKLKTVIAIANPRGKVLLVSGEIFGIVKGRAGIGGFGYDPVFYVPKYKKTLAELSLDMKNSISHRAKALKKAKKIIRELMNPSGK